jgi:hypothetical protein
MDSLGGGKILVLENKPMRLVVCAFPVGVFANEDIFLAMLLRLKSL